MRVNRLRELLESGKPTLGTRVLSSWPTVIELVGKSESFDYVEFSAEYAPYDHRALEEMGRAIDLFPHLTGMIKVEQESRTHAAVRAIGAGFQVFYSLIFEPLQMQSSVCGLFEVNGPSPEVCMVLICNAQIYWRLGPKHGLNHLIK